MVAKTETMTIQKTHSAEKKKKLTIAANLKAVTVRHLTHSNCRPDQGLNNAKITENENDRPIPC